MNQARPLVAVGVGLIFLFAGHPAISSVDVVVLMDSSGSMRTTDPLGLSREGAQLFTELLEPDDRLAVIQFDTAPSTVLPLATVGPRDGRGSLTGPVGRIAPVGQHTNLADALAAAETALDATPAGGRNRFVVMLTDGLMDTGSPTEDGAKTEELRRTAASLKSKGWPVYTIALSDQADGALMREIAEATSRTLEGRRVGRYYLASTHDELLPTFKAIYLQMNPGQQALVEGGSFLIDPTVSEAIFVVTKSIRGAKVQVTQPDGSVFDRASAPGNYRWLGGGSYDIILIEEPKPGRWKVVAEDLSDLDISVQLVTDLALEVAPIASTWPVGSGLPVFAYLAETGSRVTSLESPLYAGLEMLVDAAPPGASPVTVALQDSGAAPDETAGDGVFSGYAPPAAAEGEYALRVLARAEAFTRVRSAFTVAEAAPVTFEITSPEPGASLDRFANHHIVECVVRVLDASRPGGIIARIRKPDGEIERVVLDESGGIYRGDLGLLDPGDYRIEELSADLGARAPYACPLEHSFTVVDSVPFSAALQDSTVTADEVTVRLAITSNAVTLGQTIAVTSSVQGAIVDAPSVPLAPGESVSVTIRYPLAGADAVEIPVRTSILLVRRLRLEDSIQAQSDLGASITVAVETAVRASYALTAVAAAALLGLAVLVAWSRSRPPLLKGHLYLRIGGRTEDVNLRKMRKRKGRFQFPNSVAPDGTLSPDVEWVVESVGTAKKPKVRLSVGKDSVTCGKGQDAQLGAVEIVYQVV